MPRWGMALHPSCGDRGVQGDTASCHGIAEGQCPLGGERNMEARYLIPARYAEFAPDGTLSLIGGDHDKFIAEEYPYIQPQIVAVARVVLNREDSATEHVFKSLIIEDDTNELVAEGASGTIPTFAMAAEVNFLGTG